MVFSQRLPRTQNFFMLSTARLRWSAAAISGKMRSRRTFRSLPCGDGIDMPFACLFVPCFPVQAVVRAEPELCRLKLHRAAIAVVDGPENMMRVIACNAAAENLGVYVGMTKTQAEQHPPLVVKKRSAALEESAQSALLDCAFSFSPRVESTAPG